MSSVNKVTLVGNLGRDPEILRSANGDPVAKLSIATSETWKDKNTGDRKEKTEWHKIVIFNEHLASIADQYLRKGSKVWICGQLQTRKWTDQSGIERYVTEVVLPRFKGELIIFSSNDRQAPSQDDYGTTSTKPDHSAASQQNTSGQRFNDLDDDIPF